LIKKRIIFALLYQDGFFFLSRNFKLQRVGNVSWLVNNFGFGVTCNYIDELICLLVKKNPTKKDKEIFFLDIAQLRKKIFVPITLGGGIRTVEDASMCFLNGADKILLNTSIYDSALMENISDIYGEQAISIMIDYLRSEGKGDDKIYIKDGSEYKIELSSFFEDYYNNIPCGEIILNSIEDDGTGNGLDLRIINKIPANIKNKPLLLMGGAGKAEHIFQGLKYKNISGIVTANLFNFLGTGLEISRKKSLDNKISLANFDTEIKI